MSKPTEPLTAAEKKLLRKPIGWVSISLWEGEQGYVAYAQINPNVTKATVLDLCMGALAEERRKV